MDRRTYAMIESFMLSLMNDGAHDEQHVYRVLYAAMDIASEYPGIDLDVLIAAALLHDIGRDAQFKNPELDHAVVGARMAFDFLISEGWNPDRAAHVKECVRSHRYRTGKEPDTLEAKILFDADKLDVTGTIGIARTLAYKGIVAEPLYSVDHDGAVLDGSSDPRTSFFQEYHFKLKNVYEKFYTRKAATIAEGRRRASADFYQSMLSEVENVHRKGRKHLIDTLD